MKRLSEAPTIHPEAQVAPDVKLGMWTEVGRGTQISASEMGDRSEEHTSELQSLG